MNIEWSPLALDDRIRTFRYIAQESPRAAAGIDEAIENHAEQLIPFPESGRLGRVENTRELIVSGLPYILIYRLELGRVLILRVLHGAQRWPEDGEL